MLLVNSLQKVMQMGDGLNHYKRKEAKKEAEAMVRGLW